MASLSRATKSSEAYSAGPAPSDIGPFGYLFNFSLIGFFCFIIIVPFFWLLTSSFKDMGQFCSVPIQWIPLPWHPDNYLIALKAIPLLHYITNSIILALFHVFFGTLSSCLIAYGFSRFRFPGREFMFVILIASMMLPWQATTIPVFLFFRSLGWLNTFLPLVVPSLFGSAWNIFLMRQFFMSLPASLDEAATIDGCGPLSIFWKIILPQSKPVLVVVSLFTFMWSWKDVWGPLVYLNDSSLYTLPVGLLMFESPFEVQYTQQLAAVVIAIIPTVLFYIFGQRYLDRGITIADIK
jgi:ABC-type glycerol-3-phosphate transport system permease component